MLKVTSKIDAEELLNDLFKSEEKMVLLLSDKKSFIDMLADTSSADNVYICGKKDHAVCRIYAVMNSKGSKKNDLFKCRDDAMHEVFRRWEACGHNKKHVKIMYNSKEFKKYLNDINFFEADYIIFMVN